MIAVALTIDQVIDLPLPTLLTEVGTRIVDTEMDDAGFFGAVVEHRAEQRVSLALPAGRDEVERDVVARFLVAVRLGLDLARFPSFLHASQVSPKGIVTDVRGGWQVQA